MLNGWLSRILLHFLGHNRTPLKLKKRSFFLAALPEHLPYAHPVWGADFRTNSKKTKIKELLCENKGFKMNIPLNLWVQLHPL